MKDSSQNDIQENCLSGFKLENESIQLAPSPMILQEIRTLKAKVSFFDSWVFIIIIFVSITSFIISLILWIYAPDDSFLITFSGLIMFLLPLIFFLNRPTNVTVLDGKITIKRLMRKAIVVEKEDIEHISDKKNHNHSLRWFVRLFCLFFVPFYLIEGTPRSFRYLKGSAPSYIDLSLFLLHLSVVAMFLVQFYNSELLSPYKQAFKVTTHSNLEFTFFTDKPEEIKELLKKEAE